MTTSPSGISVTSPGTTVILGWERILSVTSRAKPWRSTARAPPASTRVASAQARIRAPQPPQLLLQKAHSVLQLVGPEGVGAAQLREVLRLVGGGLLLRLHLPEGDIDAPLRQLPGALTAGQAGADDCNVHSKVPSFVSAKRRPAPAGGRFHGGCAWCVPLDAGIQPRWRLVPMRPRFLFETSKRKWPRPVKRKNVQHDFGRRGPKIAYHTGAGRERVPSSLR